MIGQTRGMSDGMNPQSQEHPQVLVVGPGGITTAASEQDENASRERPVTDMVEQPAKVMRIGNMIRQLLEEVERLSLPFEPGGVPSESELRIAQAQLVGWLEGLFHGIQTTLFAQQMAARQQLESMRRALPPGVSLPPGLVPPGEEGGPMPPGAGQYL